MDKKGSLDLFHCPKLISREGQKNPEISTLPKMMWRLSQNRCRPFLQSWPWLSIIIAHVSSFRSFSMMQKHTSNDWRGFYPKTNVFWLHYLLDKLTSEVYYKNTKSKVHKKYLQKMRKLKNDKILNYSSAYDYVKASCEEE